MGATNWLHPLWNPTGSVNVVERPGQPNPRIVGVGGGFQQPDLAGPGFQKQRGYMPPQPVFVGGGGGWGGGAHYAPPQTAAELRGQGKLAGNYGGVMNAPSPTAAAGRGFGSVSGFYQLQAKTSPWEQAQQQQVYDRKAAGAAQDARNAWVAENPQFGNSWNQGIPDRGIVASEGVGSISRPSTPEEEAALPPLPKPAAVPWSAPAGTAPSGPVPDMMLAPNKYGTGSSTGVRRYETGGVVPPNQWAQVGDQTGNPAAAPELVRSASPIEVVPHATTQTMMWGQMPDGAPPAPNAWAAHALPPGQARNPQGMDDLLQPFHNTAGGDPRNLAVERERFMATPQGKMWLMNTDMASKAATRAAQAKQDMDVWKQGQLDKRAQNTIDAQNARAEAAIKAAADRQRTGIVSKEQEKQDQEDLDMANAVTKVHNLWRAGRLTPEDVIGFEGLHSSKAIETHLKDVLDLKKRQEPPVITRLENTDVPQVIGTGASPKLYTPPTQHPGREHVIEYDTGTGIKKPYRVAHDENGRAYLEELKPQDGPAASGGSAAPSRTQMLKDAASKMK